MENRMDYYEDDRVAIHPACDVWMQGDRYGVVTHVGRKYVTVRLDSGRTRRFTARDVTRIRTARGTWLV